jgi:hypothetical protein
MDSTHDYEWFDIGGSTNNLCKGETIPFEGAEYVFNQEGLLPASYILDDVDKLARYIAAKRKLPFIVIVRGGKTDKAGWYIKYRKNHDEMNISDKIKFCRVIETL